MRVMIQKYLTKGVLSCKYQACNSSGSGTTELMRCSKYVRNFPLVAPICADISVKV